MAKITGVEYTNKELREILTTAVEGGINYLCSHCDTERDDDGLVKRVTIHPGPENGDMSRPLPVAAGELQSAIYKVLNGQVQVNSDIVEWIRSADTGMIDATAADVLVQVVCFEGIVYG